MHAHLLRRATRLLDDQEAEVFLGQPTDNDRIAMLLDKIVELQTVVGIGQAANILGRLRAEGVSPVDNQTGWLTTEEAKANGAPY